MKWVAISDSHGLHPRLKVPACDLLIVAGDVTSRGRIGDLESFNDWLGQQPVGAVLLTPGNHDGLLANEGALKQVPRARVVINETVEFEGLKIFMSPHSLPTGTPAWQWANTAARDAIWDSIPEDVDVVVAHGPAKNVLDAANGLPTGDEKLRQRLLQLPNLKLFVCGHVHECAGVEALGEALALNATVVNHRRNLAYSPFELEYRDGRFHVQNLESRKAEIQRMRHA